MVRGGVKRSGERKRKEWSGGLRRYVEVKVGKGERGEGKRER